MALIKKKPYLVSFEVFIMDIWR